MTAHTFDLRAATRGPAVADRCTCPADGMKAGRPRGSDEDGGSAPRASSAGCRRCASRSERTGRGAAPQDRSAVAGPRPVFSHERWNAPGFKESSQGLREIAEKAGYRHSFHELRHVFATIAASEVSMASLSKILGHRRLATTSDLVRTPLRPRCRQGDRGRFECVRTQLTKQLNTHCRQNCRQTCSGPASEAIPPQKRARRDSNPQPTG